MDNTSIYMPLRSNAGFFQDDDCRARLERQIKTFLALYDFVILENGRIHLTAGSDGQGMQMQFPRNSYPGDRTEISYFRQGSPFGIQMGGNQILASTCDVAYEVDYWPIMHRAGLTHASFIQWSDYSVNPDLKSAISDAVSADLGSKRFASVLPPNRFVQSHLLEGLYGDSLLACFLKVPYCVSDHASSVLELQQTQARATWAARLPVTFFNYWINLNLPDFASLPWDELCRFRETDVGVSFREMIKRISKDANELLPDITDQRDFDMWIANAFNKELLKELSQRVSSPASIVTSLCLNVVPYGFVPGVIKDVKTLYQDHSSWVSFVRKYKTN